MKQNSSTAQVRRVVILLWAVALPWLVVACAKLPARVSSETRANQDSSGSSGHGRVNINTASARELGTLPGVGDVIAERIVNHRREHGQFRRVEHLMMVQGISEGKFRELQPLITID